MGDNDGHIRLLSLSYHRIHALLLHVGIHSSGSKPLLTAAHTNDQGLIGRGIKAVCPNACLNITGEPGLL